MSLLPRQFPESVVRLWVHLYTTGLPPEAKRSRRDEVDSDLFESRSESSSLIEATICLVAGIADDLAWRMSQITPGAALIQGITLAVAVGATVAFFTGHMLQALGILPYLAVGPGLIATAAVSWLLTRADKEEIRVMTREVQHGHVLYQQILALGALLAPPLAFAAILMIGFDNHPREDNSDIVKLAADHTTRFAAGYVLYAVALTLLAMAVLLVSGLAREAGARVIGAAVPIVFLLCGTVIIVGGHGLQGLALAVVTQAGMDGRQYYLEANNDSAASFAAFLAGTLTGFALLALAFAVWRRRLVGGPMRVAVSVALVLLAIVFALSSGYVVEAGAVLIPVFSAIAFYPFAWKELTSSASSSVSGGWTAASHA